MKLKKFLILFLHKRNQSSVPTTNRTRETKTLVSSFLKPSIEKRTIPLSKKDHIKRKWFTLLQPFGIFHFSCLYVGDLKGSLLPPIPAIVWCVRWVLTLLFRRSFLHKVWSYTKKGKLVTQTKKWLIIKKFSKCL